MFHDCVDMIKIKSRDFLGLIKDTAGYIFRFYLHRWLKFSKRLSLFTKGAVSIIVRRIKKKELCIIAGLKSLDLSNKLNISTKVY